MQCSEFLLNPHNLKISHQIFFTLPCSPSVHLFPSAIHFWLEIFLLLSHFQFPNLALLFWLIAVSIDTLLSRVFLIVHPQWNLIMLLLYICYWQSPLQCRSCILSNSKAFAMSASTMSLLPPHSVASVYFLCSFPLYKDIWSIIASHLYSPKFPDPFHCPVLFLKPVLIK